MNTQLIDLFCLHMTNDSSSPFFFQNFLLLSLVVGQNQPQLHAPSTRKVRGIDSSSKFSLPIFGLASYKLRGPILTPSEADEWQQANSLLQAADGWLQGLQVNLPDFQFFVSHSSPRR